MLINFKFSNFRLFKDETNLQLKAFDKENEKRLSKHFPDHELYLNRLALIYGANASGKSTLTYAITTMQSIVRDSFTTPKLISNKTFYTPYRFQEGYDKSDINFNVELILDDEYYSYGFVFNSTKITKEYLYKGKNKKSFFKRTANNKVEASKDFKNGWEFDSCTKLLQKDSLFLTAGERLGCKQFKPVFDWFNEKLIIINQDLMPIRQVFLWDVNEKIKNEKKEGKEDFKLWLNDLIKKADNTVDAIHFHEIDGPKYIVKAPDLQERNKVDYTLSYSGVEMESSFTSTGIWKSILYSKIIFDALINGKTLFIDEIDENWHPLIVRNLIEKFNYNEENNAQLIATTHDAAQLKNIYRSSLKKDEVWFTKKDDTNKAELYSLADFEPDENKKTPYDSDYLYGVFGAIPDIK
jgi:AAA15 family ATPase/GTPase